MAFLANLCCTLLPGGTLIIYVMMMSAMMMVMMMVRRGRITADGDDDAEDYSGSADDYIGCRRLPGQPGQAYRRTFIEFTQCQFAFGSR